MTLWEELLPLTSQLHGKVLDAGCGNGIYSKLVSEMPSVTEVISLDKQFEPSSYGTSFRQNRPNGIFFQGDIEDLRIFKDNEFNCVMCWHVIEHTDSPKKAIKELKRITKDLLMICLPTYPDGGAWDSPEHTQFFTISSFETLCKECGLLPLEFYKDSSNCQNWLFKSGNYSFTF